MIKSLRQKKNANVEDIFDRAFFIHLFIGVFVLLPNRWPVRFYARKANKVERVTTE